MSFYLQIEARGLTWERAAAIVDACNRGDGLRTSVPRRPLILGRNRSPLIWVEDRAGTDELLADDAHWDASMWSMNSHVLPRLVTTLQCLSHELREGFTFLASWDGFKVRGTRSVRWEDLRQLAARGELAAHVRYVVGNGEE